MPAGLPQAHVVRVRSKQVVYEAKVHWQILREMLDAVILGLFPSSNPNEAWTKAFKPGDVIGLKFNRSGQVGIGTAEAMAEAVITALLTAGFDAEQIVCIEAPAAVTKRLGTRPARPGYAKTKTDFGSGSDEFAAVLDQITALINIPFLKTHNISGMTCGLKNLSHGLVKHPARHHANGCSPFIADIVATEAIKSKLRFTIVDALRVVYADGPSASVENISDEGILLASKDPVAVDAVGVDTLNAIRAKERLDPIVERGATLPFLAAAHRRSLGIALPQGINVNRVDL